MPVDVIDSVTGRKYTNRDGHYFRLSQKLNGKLYLNCHLRSCRVRGNIAENFSPENDTINCKGTHNHPPDFYEAEFCMAEKRLLDRAARDPTSLRRIFQEETAHLSPKTMRRLNYCSFIRRMQRRRQLDFHLIPDSLNDFAERMDTEEYRDFAYMDDKKFFIGNVKNRAIIFMSPTMRKLCRGVDHTYIIYQTKKVITTKIRNVMIIAQVIANVAFPIAYIAVRTRQKSTYIGILRKILEEEPSWNPSLMFVSREVTLTSAIEATFSNCKIVHAWFHLAQELRKTIKNFNLIDLLHSDLDFFNYVNWLQVIPLLPAKYMSDAYDLVKKRALNLWTNERVRDLFQYVKDNWLMAIQSANITFFDKTDRLKIEVKSLHHHFMSSFRANTRKDAIWSFSKGLMTLEKKYSDAYKEYLLKESPPKWTSGRAVRNLEKKVRVAMSRFSSGKMSMENFLENVAQTNINIMDLNDEDIQEASTDEEEEEEDEEMDVDDTSADFSGDVKCENTDWSADACNDEFSEYEEFIVEEIEEEEEVLEDESSYFVIDEEDIKNDPEAVKKEPELPTEMFTDKKPFLVDEIESHLIEEKCSKKMKTENSTIKKEEEILVFRTSNPETKVNNVETQHPCLNCKKLRYSFACQPCGHLCLCDQCCDSFVKQNCPMCTATVMWIQEISLPHPLD